MSFSPRRTAPLALLTVAALAWAATPAEAAKAPDKAAPVISAVVLAPTVVALNAKSSGTTSFTVSGRVSDPGGVDRVVIGLYDSGDTKGRSFRLARSAGTALNGTWSVQANLPNGAKKGAWSVRAYAVDKASNSSDPDKVYATFSVTYLTRMTRVNVTPEPVHPEGELSATARVDRYRPGKGWTPYADRNVVLEFRKEGAKNFAAVAKGTTDSAGKVSFTKVKPTTTGVWRITYAGNSSYAPSVSRTDTVKVAAAKAAAVASAAPTTPPEQ